ncbi:MAG: P-II family nitrogen regulator [Pseudomonadales bacterium]
MSDFGDFIYLTDVAAITCVVDAVRAEKVALAGKDAGARAAIGQTAHGWGARERFGALAVAVETDKAVITFIVSVEQQDAVFESIYRTAELNNPGAGYMYITPLDRAATYLPSAVRKRLGLEDSEE